METNIKTLINQLSRRLFIIDKEMEDKKGYKNLIETGFDYLRSGFEIKELRECPIKFKFHENDETVHTVQLRHFLVNLIFWEPMITLESSEYLDETYIIEPSRISSGYIKSYIDEKLVIPYKRKVSNKNLNKILCDLIYNLGKISTEFNIVFGMGMTVESFINVANKNPRFNEIIRTMVDPSMQPSEIEATLHNLTDEQVEILKNEPNVLQPMLRSGSGIKPKQLAEFSINGGLKPDLSGRTIPIPINSNFLVSGTNSVSGYFIDAIGARKSLIFNKNVMGKSGHFARKTMLVVSDIKLREDSEHCGSVHPIMYEIKTKKHLERLVGRNYRLPNQIKYSVLKKNDTHLIGKKILVKSPMTCASHNGICEECYGDMLFHTNSNGVGIGAYAGAIITNPLSQSILSSKHLLTTISESITFTDAFNDFFSLDANEITLNTHALEDNLDKYSLIIMKDDLVTLEDLDEGEINEYVTKFYVKNNETHELIEIKETKSKSMYISTELKSLIKLGKKQKDIYTVDFSEITDLQDDCRLFLLQVENAELTRPLYTIMGLLDGKERRNKLGVETLSDFAQQMLDLMIESKIDAQAVHAEVLLTPLIRSISDVLVKPDFRKYDAITDTQVLTISAALEKHPSLLVGLSFQYIGRQLQNPLTFKKTGKSYLDPFFKESL